LIGLMNGISKTPATMGCGRFLLSEKHGEKGRKGPKKTAGEAITHDFISQHPPQRSVLIEQGKRSLAGGHDKRFLENNFFFAVWFV